MDQVPHTAKNGFTLTEILVVSVIVAILSAVTVPIYTNYIKDQRLDAVKNIASAAAVAANVLYRRTNAIPDCGSSCADVLDLLLPEKDRYSVSLNADKREVTVTDLQHTEATVTTSF